MRQAIAIVIGLAAVSGAPAAFAQPGVPPLLTPAPPAPTPPPLFVPPAVPPANPMPAPLSPGYGTPPGINTTTPLGATPRAIYRQPADPRRKHRHRKKRPFRSSER